MSDNTLQPVFFSLVPWNMHVSYADLTLPPTKQAAQRHFDYLYAGLLDHEEQKFDNLLRGDWRTLDMELDRAKGYSKWASVEALSAQLKTKGELEAEKLAEKLYEGKLAEVIEAELQGDTDASGDEGDGLEDGAQGGGDELQPFGTLVTGSGNSWDEDMMITEQADFWEEAEEEEEEDETGGDDMFAA